MLINVSLPFLDIREILNDDNNKIQVDEVYVYGEEPFHRGFGMIRDRYPLENAPSRGEEFYFGAKGGIKITDTFTVSNDENKFRPKYIYRRLFTEKYSYRFDIGITNSYGEDFMRSAFTGRELKFIVKKFLMMPVTIPHVEKCSLIKSPPALAKLILDTSTKRKEKSEKHETVDWLKKVENQLILPTDPFVVIQLNEKEIGRLGDDFIMVKNGHLENWGIQLYYTAVQNIRCWLIIRNPHTNSRKLRELRVYLQKTHQDRGLLKLLLFVITSEKYLFVKSPNYDGLTKFLDPLIKGLNKNVRHSIDNHYMKKLIYSIDGFLSPHALDNIITKINEDDRLKDFVRRILIASGQNLVDENEPTTNEVEFDFFISHASEDKEDFVEPLVEQLENIGFKVWYDKFEIKIGESLRREIDKGIENSRYAIVVASHNYFNKNWAQAEFNALMKRHIGNRIHIIPLYYKISANEVEDKSALFSDLLGLNTEGYTFKDIALILKKQVTG